jgi:hypothetical protein
MTWENQYGILLEIKLSDIQAVTSPGRADLAVKELARLEQAQLKRISAKALRATLKEIDSSELKAPKQHQLEFLLWIACGEMKSVWQERHSVALRGRVHPDNRYTTAGYFYDGGCYCLPCGKGLLRELELPDTESDAFLDSKVVPQPIVYPLFHLPGDVENDICVKCGVKLDE